MIYLDNAATTGVKPLKVQSAVINSMKNLSANPGRSGHKISMLAAEKIYECRNKISSFFGAKGAERVVFTQNCTMSINMVLKGVLSPFDHVIVSSLEHNAVMRPLNTLKERFNIEYDVAEVIFDDDQATFRSFERLIKQNTKLIFCTHASNVTGSILPISKIGKLCKAKGILFGVDAAQTAGVLPINMNNDNIDFLCIAPHKGLYSPMGVGVLIANKPLKNTIIEGGTGSDSYNLFQPSTMPEGLESGTVNLPAIMGVLAGVDFVNAMGISKLYNHEMDLIQRAYNGLNNLKNVTLYLPYPKKNSFAPVLPFNVKGFGSDETANLLNSNNIAVRAGLHCAPSAHKRLGTVDSGAVRISTAYFNNLSDIDRLINVISNKKIMTKILK